MEAISATERRRRPPPVFSQISRQVVYALSPGGNWSPAIKTIRMDSNTTRGRVKAPGSCRILQVRARDEYFVASHVGQGSRPLTLASSCRIPVPHQGARVSTWQCRRDHLARASCDSLELLFSASFENGHISGATVQKACYLEFCKQANPWSMSDQAAASVEELKALPSGYISQLLTQREAGDGWAALGGADGYRSQQRQQPWQPSLQPG
ncbi:hypothetical protein LTS07_011341 [Exophiala sideris]|uniref:Uncharacterized protein n=1 Tax=Exophiala sideris TaxID=1016849 RepID=A0ABR0IUW4_9EURO|nr:hypothetical protein LTS07_011341 [Exophiala sideris]KAK5023124.1 hypothetical protein LTR13_011330 [Exophiala sideris]KAK5048452.1 hypothetical protein LTR69_011366 [Exophiala sideris]KAK5176106.1 hypothetical protein LTR44_011351 [Eurotiomycetes sp. CCFEE 6388]